LHTEILEKGSRGIINTFIIVTFKEDGDKKFERKKVRPPHLYLVERDGKRSCSHYFEKEEKKANDTVRNTVEDFRINDIVEINEKFWKQEFYPQVKTNRGVIREIGISDINFSGTIFEYIRVKMEDIEKVLRFPAVALTLVDRPNNSEISNFKINDVIKFKKNKIRSYCHINNIY
jgi:hypothetical protein